MTFDEFEHVLERVLHVANHAAQSPERRDRADVIGLSLIDDFLVKYEGDRIDVLVLALYMTTVALVAGLKDPETGEESLTTTIPDGIIH